MEGSALSLAVAFIVSVVAGLIAVGIGQRMDRAHQAPPAADESWPIVHPNSTLLLTAAYLALSVWVFVPSMVIVLLVDLAFNLPPAFVIVPLVAFVATLPMGLLLALFLRCTTCRKRLLVQEISSPPFLDSDGRGDGHATYVRIATERRCRCMYCGQQYLIRRA